MLGGSGESGVGFAEGSGSEIIPRSSSWIGEVALFTGHDELGGGVVFFGLGEGGKVGKCSGYCG